MLEAKAPASSGIARGQWHQPVRFKYRTGFSFAEKAQSTPSRMKDNFMEFQFLYYLVAMNNHCTVQ